MDDLPNVSLTSYRFQRFLSQAELRPFDHASFRAAEQRFHFAENPYDEIHKPESPVNQHVPPNGAEIRRCVDYIAENLDVPTVVLQYPSKRGLIRELKKGYDYVGISFIMAVMHKMKETVALIRHYAPNSKIVLGGYGTVLKDEVLKR
jgi:hypothetical protein